MKKIKLGSHQEFMDQLVLATLNVRDQGTTAPTALEIASESWPLPTGVPAYHLEEVRKRMDDIRRHLRKRGYTVVPVSTRYYSLRRRDPANLTDRDTSACMALGRGKVGIGILFVDDNDVLAKRIMVAHERAVYGAGAGKTSASRKRLGHALDGGLISREEMLAITDSNDEVLAIEEIEPDDDDDVIDAELVEDIDPDELFAEE